MIGLQDLYKVMVAMAPLYMALGLGYGSVRWWRMFKPDQCDAINRFNCYFIMPFFTFQFISGVDPYHMNFRFLAGDVVAKAIVGGALALWANLWRNGDLSWAITSFSLSSFNNTLVVGVPLLKAMYGEMGEDLVVQSSVIQSLIWFPILLFLLEFRRTYWINRSSSSTPHNIHSEAASDSKLDQNQLTSIEIVAMDKNNKLENQKSAELAVSIDIIPTTENRIHFGTTMKKVCVKLAKNPNSYASALGLIWALLAKRWDLEMPSIVEGSLLIMAKAGSGVAMFTMGLFMALQEKLIACGVRLTLYGMVMRFAGGPFTTMVGSLAFGLRSDVLHVAIIQAALPQAIASFVYAQEYGLHADLLSTLVIFGTIVSLPLLIAYYVILDVVH